MRDMSAQEADKINPLAIAAGFGTRMGIDIPKGLIEVSGQPIVGRMLAELLALQEEGDVPIGHIALTTNSRFFPQYRDWLRQEGLEQQVTLLDNGVSDSAERRGAIGDMVWAMDKLGWWQEKAHLLVLPSDTVYQFRLVDFLKYSLTKTPSGLVIVANRLDKQQIVGRLGCVTLKDGEVVNFDEKPQTPQSDMAIVPFYFYPHSLVPKIQEYVTAAGGARERLDAPSTIISWFLEQNIPVFAYETEPSIDVGTRPDIAAAQRYFPEGEEGGASDYQAQVYVQVPIPIDLSRSKT